MNDELLDILDESVSQGRFYATGQLPKLDFTLEIKDFGSVPLPVTADNAEQIIRKCQRAPYGLGSKTLVDTSVRNVWELAPRKFKIQSADWKKQLAAMVKDVGTQLGLEGQKIKAQLYKLLVYEKGSFFVAHQDTERTAGMFATLVVSLPSKHSGGALIVSHTGEDKKITFGGKNSATTFQYAGFYADCSHEIKPITGGYRVCLVYNLSLPQKKPMPLSARNKNVEEKVTDFLRTWVEETEQPEKMVFLFDHQYTEAELSLQNLKNKDSVNGEILYRAAQKVQCTVHLALLTFHQNGEPEGAYDDYAYYGRRRYSYYEDDDDDSVNSDDYTMGEVFSEELNITQWFTVGGHKKEMGFIPLADDEIIASIDFTDIAPDESDYEGYMGNYGPSLDRWYHRAALVIWPEKYHYAIVVQAGPVSSVPELAALTRKMLDAGEPEKPTLLADCRTFAAVILQHGRFESRENNQSILSMLDLLPALQDEAMAREFFRAIFVHALYGDEGKALAGFLDAMGWKNFAQDLIALFERSSGPADKMVRLLKELYGNITDTETTGLSPAVSEKLDILKQVAECIPEKIKTWDNTGRTHYYFENDAKNTADNKRMELIRSVTKDCFTLFSEQASNDLICYFTTTENIYSLHDVLIPLLQYYAQSGDEDFPINPAIEKFVQSLVDILREHTRSPIQIPNHWKMQASWKCDCKDCLLLKEFLKNPVEKSLHVKMAKERRRHMHTIINQHVTDLSHETLRRGSPYTLIFEKNRNSYAVKEKLWQKELKVLTTFQEGDNRFTVNK
jgi:hypothetical protein